jgi:hypothetical protein
VEFTFSPLLLDLFDKTSSLAGGGFPVSPRMPNQPLLQDVEHPEHVYESPIFKCMRGFNMTEVSQLGVKWREILKASATVRQTMLRNNITN